RYTDALTLMPAISVFAYWLGGDFALIIAVLAFPILPLSGVFARDDRRPGPSTLRTRQCSVGPQVTRPRTNLRHDIKNAVARGDIELRYEPQVSTDTGQVIGLSANPCLRHATQGEISAARIYDATAGDELKEQLSANVIHGAFTALKSWDAAGLHIPLITLRFSAARMADRYLADKVKWELVRFDLDPRRLVIEVDDFAALDPTDEFIKNNCRRLADLGCCIDFRITDHNRASMQVLRRYFVHRIVFSQSNLGQGRDAAQHHSLSAILVLADAAGVKTLATGVKNAGQHALLAQLGCQHVQGHGISAPLSFDQTIQWMSAHKAKLCDMPVIIARNP
ncbi:MAG: EAL domain-containing protein, partial [Sulfitobacter sp.]